MAVVVAAGRDPDLVIGDLVDRPVFICDAAKPVAGKVVFEGFGLADAFVAVTDDVLAQLVDAFEDLAVLGLPPQVVFPGVGARRRVV